jgi:hypothetical protein
MVHMQAQPNSFLMTAPIQGIRHSLRHVRYGEGILVHPWVSSNDLTGAFPIKLMIRDDDRTRKTQSSATDSPTTSNLCKSSNPSICWKLLGCRLNRS